MVKTAVTQSRNGRSPVSDRGRGNLFRSSQERVARATQALGGSVAVRQAAPPSAVATIAPATGERYDERAIIVELKDIRLVPEFGRTFFNPDEMDEMKSSIAAQGILEPLLLRTSLHNDYKYDLLAGYRRFKGLTELKMTEAPGIIIDADDVKAAAASLSENLQRQNPSADDQARAFYNLKAVMEQQLERFLVTAAGGTYGAMGKAGEKKLGKITAAHSVQLQKTWKDTPDWLWRIIDNAEKTGRKPKVGIKDICNQVGLAERTVHNKMQIAALPEDIRKKITEGVIPERVAKVIVTVRGADEEDTAKRRRSLVRVIESAKRRNNPLSDAEVTEHARRLTARGKGETAGLEVDSDDDGMAAPPAHGSAAPARIREDGPDRSASLAIGAMVHVVRDAARSAKPHVAQAIEILEAMNPKKRQAYYDAEVAPYVKRVRNEWAPIAAALERVEELGRA